jgi:hypothetical protein
MTIAWAIVSVAVLYLLDKHHLLKKTLILAGIVGVVLVVGYAGFLEYQHLKDRWEDYQFARNNECYSPSTGKVHPTNSSEPWCGYDEQVYQRGIPLPVVEHSTTLPPEATARSVVADPAAGRDSGTVTTLAPTRWASASLLGFAGGESINDTLTQASKLGLMETGNCKPRPGTDKYTDCEFSGSNADSMEASLYLGQLQRLDYKFRVDRYGEILAEIESANGMPRSSMTGPDDKEWGSFKQRFGISLGKTADGTGGYASLVFDPPKHE